MQFAPFQYFCYVIGSGLIFILSADGTESINKFIFHSLILLDISPICLYQFTSNLKIKIYFLLKYIVFLA